MQEEKEDELQMEKDEKTAFYLSPSKSCRRSCVVVSVVVAGVMFSLDLQHVIGWTAEGTHEGHGMPLEPLVGVPLSPQVTSGVGN